MANETEAPRADANETEAPRADANETEAPCADVARARLSLSSSGGDSPPSATISPLISS